MTEPTKRDKMPCDYTKKPVTIQAIEWTGDNLRAVIDFTGLHESAAKWSWAEYEHVVKADGLKIFTLEGPMMASVGDYIIRGVKGEFYACKPDIFAATYAASAQSAEPWHITAPDQNGEYGVWAGKTKCIAEGLTLAQAQALVAKSPESAEPQEAEAQRHEIRFINSTPDEGYIRRILEAYIDDSYYSDNTAGLPPENEVCKMMNKWREERNALLRAALARLASKPSRSEAPELDEAALADTAYGPSGYNPGNEWQNCRDMINHIQWQYHKHAGDSGVDEATENALASLDLLHKHYAARPSREEEMRTVLAEIERYARASLCDHRGGSPDVGSCPNCKSYLHIIELARAALAQGGARDGGEKR